MQTVLLKAPGAGAGVKREIPQRTLTTVAIADSHEILRAGLRMMFERLGSCQVVGEVGDGRAIVEMAQELSPDLIIMDLMLPLLNGIEAMRQIKAARADARVMICAEDENQRLMEEALRAGASAFLLKSSSRSEFAVAISAVLRGEIYLSPRMAGLLVDRHVRHAGNPVPLTEREREVLRLIAEGHSNNRIADRLELSSRTVEAHRMKLMEKLHIHTVADLTKYAIREGITSLDA